MLKLMCLPIIEGCFTFGRVLNMHPQAALVHVFLYILRCFVAFVMETVEHNGIVFAFNYPSTH